MKMGLYMLYQSKIKQGQEETMDNLRTEFEDLYKKHNIEIIGAWANEEDSTETFYLSRYENKEDYEKKTGALRKDTRYAELTDKLKEVRLDSKAIRLIPKWLPE
ncbi:MAG: NIPSNAP family protein [Candidatus Thorarchaeota archaeon]|jgi:hypothetical protein